MKPRIPSSPRVVVVGAGIAGLAAAVDLARRGVQTTLVECGPAAGGKMREVDVDGWRVDSGPTVLTLRDVFDDLFAAAGARLDDHLTLQPASVLARHAWGPEARMDLHADARASEDAVGRFAGAAEARRFRAFCTEAARIYRTLDHTFMRAARPGPLELARRVGLRHLGDLIAIRPFTSMWRALGEHFHDPRLRQLFGRYATYCGSSPFDAPATLMLVAHVEQKGVWFVDGGMHRLAGALDALARSRGADLRYGRRVERITTDTRGVTGIELDDGERIAADAVVFNGDVRALHDGRLGEGARRAVPAPGARSLSAVTWSMVAATRGFPLERHNVFFSQHYADEFRDLRDGALPREPTVYVCAQDRPRAAEAGGPERLLCLVNAPARGDAGAPDDDAVERCERATFAMLKRCGLDVDARPGRARRTTPRDFARLFPGSGGALYGSASHGWRSSFTRPGARSRVPGLYLAGGSVHPGPGVPMTALSGRLAAAALCSDLGLR